MNKNTWIPVALGLACCSMQALSAPPAAAPRIVSLTIPLEPPLIAKDAKGLPPPRLCHLGGDCLTMDSHPFEVCHVSIKSCGDKLAEVLQVQQPTIIVKPSKAR